MIKVVNEEGVDATPLFFTPAAVPFAFAFDVPVAFMLDELLVEPTIIFDFDVVAVIVAPTEVTVFQLNVVADGLQFKVVVISSSPSSSPSSALSQVSPQVFWVIAKLVKSDIIKILMFLIFQF